MPHHSRLIGRLVLGVLVVGGAALFLTRQLRSSPAVDAYERGKMLTAAHLDADARAVYEEAVRLDPHFAPPYRALAETADTQDDLATAVRWWKAYLARAPRPEHAWCRLAEAELKSGDSAPAFADAQHELQLNPACARAHLLIGLLYERRSAAQPAREHLAFAARAYPDREPVQLAYGRVLALSGDYDRAEQVLQGILTHNAPRAEPFRWLAYVIAHRRSDPSSRAQAESYLRRALALKPDYPEANCELGRLYLDRHRADLALPYAQKAVAERKHYPRALYLLAGVYRALGRPVEAARREREFRRESDLALRRETLLAQYKSNPGKIATALALGQTLQARGETEAALYFLRDALQHNPNDPQLQAAWTQAQKQAASEQSEGLPHSAASPPSLREPQEDISLTEKE